jgi:hypothetical protein
MNTNTDFDRRATAWLADGPTELSDRVLDAALSEVHLTNQRRRWSTPWRNLLMSAPVRVVAAIALVAIIGVTAFMLSNRGPQVGGPATPTPRVETPVPSKAGPTAGPTAAPTLSLDTATWKAYASTRYGYTLAYPDGWMAVPADRDWVAGTDPVQTESDVDQFVDGRVSGDRQILLTSFSTLVPAGTSEDAWIQGWAAPFEGSNPMCLVGIGAMTPITVDGQPGRLSPTCDGSVAFVFVGGRAFVFSVWRPDQQELLKAFVSTVGLAPA